MQTHGTPGEQRVAHLIILSGINGRPPGMMSLPLVIMTTLFTRVIINRIHVFIFKKFKIKWMQTEDNEHPAEAAVEDASQASPREELVDQDPAVMIPFRARAKKSLYGVARWALVPFTEDQMDDLRIGSQAAFYLSLSWSYFTLSRWEKHRTFTGKRAARRDWHS